MNTMRNLRLLWAGQFISKVGDQFLTVAGIMLVMTLAQESEPTAAGIMMSARSLPALILGVLAGALVDRMNRRALMVVCDVACAVVLGALVGVWLMGWLEWWMLPLAAALASTFIAAFEPARDALIPELVATGNLARVNSFFHTSVPVAILVGSALIALASLGKTGNEEATLVWLLGADALTFLGSAILVFLVRPPRSRRMREVKRARGESSLLADAKVGLSFALKDRRLRGLLAMTAANNFFIMGPATVGAAILFRRELKQEGVDAIAAFALFEGFMFLGLLGGLLFMLRWGSKRRLGKVLLLGLIGDGLTYLPFLLLEDVKTLWPYYLLITVHGFFIPWIWVSRTSIIQHDYPRHMHGRIFALVAVTVTGCMSVSALVTGFAGEVVTAWWLFFVGGVGGMLTGMLGFLNRPLVATRGHADGR